MRRRRRRRSRRRRGAGGRSISRRRRNECEAGEKSEALRTVVMDVLPPSTSRCTSNLH
jgi:hypothetical protein